MDAGLNSEFGIRNFRPPTQPKNTKARRTQRNHEESDSYQESKEAEVTLVPCFIHSYLSETRDGRARPRATARVSESGWVGGGGGEFRELRCRRGNSHPANNLRIIPGIASLDPKGPDRAAPPHSGRGPRSDESLLSEHRRAEDAWPRAEGEWRAGLSHADSDAGPKKRPPVRAAGEFTYLASFSSLRPACPPSPRSGRWPPRSFPGKGCQAPPEAPSPPLGPSR